MSSFCSSTAATSADAASAPEDVPEVRRVDSLYSPHDVCEAAVDYVLRNVNTIQYMIQSIEEITGKPFLRDRIKCLPLAPRNGAPCVSTRGLTPDRVYAGYIWRSGRSDCQTKDVVLLEDHVARLFSMKHAANFLKKDTGDNECTSSSPSTSRTAAAAASSPSTTASPPQLERLLVESQLPVLEQVERSIRHELVHAFDDARGAIEYSDCMHQACSEIRAARLSGDCFVGQEMRKGRFNFFEGGQKCVRRRAVIAVDRNPVCRGFSERAVDTVFRKCYSDYEPFAAPIYSLGSYGHAQFANGTLKP
ncbi:putative Peptidase M76 family [Leishmania naiffi]|uniref:Mitochondrial inner membrane protease ATP23 n=1 Tax=Leishmania naiffi TaxID=5678 RepID=A0AAW3B3J7_9TRYP